MFDNNLAIFVAVSISLLSGCSGGGSASITPSDPVSTSSFPLQSAYKTLVADGMTKNFTVSGACSGTGIRTISPATTAATFEGVAGFSAVESLTMSFTDCTPASFATTSTSYYDTNYVPVGFNSVGINYGVYLTPPTIPASVTVGGAEVVGTETLYTDSTKATGIGRVDVSYVVEADSATAVIVNLIGKNYNAVGTLIATEQDRYRISATGALTPISADIQYANGSTTHLVITYN